MNKFALKSTIILFLILFTVACSTKSVQEQEPIKISESVIITEDVAIQNRSKQINSFHYQLQDTDFEKLKQLDVDLLVIDVDDSKLNKSQIRELKKTKYVLSYLSIGEAEDYRDYWSNNLDFILEENPNWKGNYKVKYWNTEWQNIIRNKIQKIKELGYDGVYLDKVDAYDDFEKRISAPIDMIDFVNSIDKKYPDMLIYAQNALELYQYPKYVKSIDGIGLEDTWYNDDYNELWDNTWYKILKIKEIQKEKTVLLIDYPTKNHSICKFYENCKDQYFVCTVSNRELNKDSPIKCII